MWASLYVCVADVLEVRGSNLHEDEAWALLMEISKQLRNESPRHKMITPYNVQINSTGAVSIDFSSQCSNSFEEFYHNSIASNNVLSCSLGMTILWCLQNGIPSNKYLAISDELQSTLTMLTSTESSFESLEEAFSLYDKPDKKLSTRICFIKMYESVLGREAMSRLVPVLRPQSEKAIRHDEINSKPKQRKVSKENTKVIHQHQCNNLHESSQSVAIMHSTMNEQMHERQEEVISASLQQQRNIASEYIDGDDRLDGDVVLESNILLEKETSLPQRKPRSHIINQKVVYAKSTLKNTAYPIHLNLCLDKHDFKKSSKAVVEYLNGHKLITTMNTSKTSCGHLLSIAASHLASATNCSLLGLAVCQDGEYIFVENSASLDKISSLHGIAFDHHFYLRLKFLPQDHHSCDENLLQTMYLQIRKDVMDGRILCYHEHAMLLAAYSMQFELGDVGNIQGEYFMRDFLSSSTIAELGHSYISCTLPRLHAKLQGTPITAARDMYISKARQLNDFGNHFILVYMSQKSLASATCWLAIGPRGLKIFRMQLGNVRKTVHQYDWENLKKISFKNTAVLLSTKEGVKLKFFVRKERKSKYIVRMMGEMHQFHRFDDFQDVDSFQCSNIPIAKPRRLVLPFKRFSITPLRREHNPVEVESVNPNHQHEISESENFEVPEIIPFVSSNEDSELANTEVLDAQESSAVEETCSAIEPEQSDDDEADSVSLNEEEETDGFDVNELPPPIIQELSGEFQVDLEKINGSFGFTILGGSDKQISVIKVHKIVPGGAADRNGMIQSGDVILAINNLLLGNLTHKSAAETIGRAPAKSRLHIKRDGIITIESIPSPKTQVEKDDEVFTESLDYAEDVAAQTTSIVIENSDRPSSYDDRVSQVASAFYNYQYTDIESEFQHQYIGSGAENLSLKYDTHTVEEDVSRGEGDGISNFSGPDHRISTPQSNRLSDENSALSRRYAIPEATVNTTRGNFEDIRRRLSSLKNANESSSNSGENESWSTDRY